MNTSLQGIFIPPKWFAVTPAASHFAYLPRENNMIFASTHKANGQPFHVWCLDSSQHIKTWLLSTCTYCMYRHNRLKVSAKEKSHQHLNFFKVNSSQCISAAYPWTFKVHVNLGKWSDPIGISPTVYFLH